MIRILIGLVLLLSIACFNNTDLDNTRKISVCYYEGGSFENCIYEVVVIDSCEYVYVVHGYSTWGSHKGNCRFCSERLKIGDSCELYRRN